LLGIAFALLFCCCVSLAPLMLVDLQLDDWILIVPGIEGPGRSNTDAVAISDVDKVVAAVGLFAAKSPAFRLSLKSLH